MIDQFIGNVCCVAYSEPNKHETNKIFEFNYNPSKQPNIYETIPNNNTPIPITIPMTPYPTCQTTSPQYQQVLQLFSTYLNDMTLVINTIKRSIYQILNIQLHSSQALVQPSIASVSANGKKTLDDMKRISSILRGYSRSKNIQREEEQTKRSRIESSSLSRYSESRMSRYSYNNSDKSEVNFSHRVGKGNGVEGNGGYDNDGRRDDGIGMVTFDLGRNGCDGKGSGGGELTNEEFVSRLRHYRSLRSLSKTTELPNVQKLPQAYDPFQNPNPTPTHHKQPQTLAKSRALSQVITQTQTKFKQCLQKHETGMDQIIKRNGECLDILKDIQRNLKSKKQDNNSRKKGNGQALGDAWMRGGWSSGMTVPGQVIGL